MKKTLHDRTIILSDVHLGTAHAKVREVNHFLKHTQSEKLILNGDIIDGWQPRRGSSWKKQHTGSCGSCSKAREEGYAGRPPARQS